MSRVDGDDALPPTIASLLAAVTAHPEDVPLRLLLVRQLLDAGRGALAATHAAGVLERDAGHVEALALLGQATALLSGAGPAAFDWDAAEAEVEGIAQPAFVADVEPDDDDELADPDLARPATRLADVGGMQEVKRRLDVAFLKPMANPELRALYGRQRPGGMLLYGPPGCGKTFLARAVAGELGAGFHSVGLSDVLDMWIGASEKNLHEAFQIARRHAPCVLFLDEIDALGQKRSQLRSNAAMRGTVNQLLVEMDSVQDDNEGVFILGATNHPWDVDSALLRPGRFDRMLFVAPPDLEAREAILRHHLADRPVEGIDLRKLAKRTEHHSGADLAHWCDSAAELALEDSIDSGTVRMIDMKDFDRARKDVKPSIGGWLDDARNVVLFANQSGRYDDLLAYLKARKLA